MVLVYASIHKHSEAGQDRNQAVCALQTEPIVCRWAFNGPTAGHKDHTAPARCYASHWPLLSHPEEEAAHRHTNATVYLHFSHYVLPLQACVLVLVKILGRLRENRLQRHVPAEMEKEVCAV